MSSARRERTRARRRRPAWLSGFDAIVASALLVALWSWPTEASAYTCMQLGCPTWEGQVPLALGATSADLEALEAGTTAAQLSMAAEDWSLLQCADLSLSDLGTSTAAPGDVDGISVLGFIESDWPHDPSAIGFTTIDVTGCTGGPSCIIEADTALNGEGFRWVTVRGSLPEVNAYSIFLHELGHYVGLGHTNDEAAAMFAGYTRGYLTLGADDEEGLCALYPLATPPQSCSAGECPFGQSCVDGSCEPSSTDRCVQAMDCAWDERCIPATGRCVRGELLAEDLGMPCERDGDCVTGQCEDLGAGQVCTVTCDGSMPRSCPFGFYCDPGFTEACDTGLCVEGSSMGGAFGSSCAVATDCGSLFCAEETCSIPCNPSQVGNCPAGFGCHPDAGSGCGACLSLLALGERCRVNGQCESSLCFVDDGSERGFCSAACASEADCPMDLRCEVVDEAGSQLCLPPPSGCAAGGGGHGGRSGLVLLVALVLLHRGKRSSSALVQRS